ncbi:hypothetical protein KIH74_14355 [Kineosporia sp. J2-2]|uniref:Uncharacterized protein n=1 Tax=Kineosporia corallincola TaxID=2835133 RepID=A0ABS5TG97_9ACTN|nr:hypothetical protein [Kineosporia corallincola]MBT0770118.1 hypothetical protein [Kineosporia corallincola]
MPGTPLTEDSILLQHVGNVQSFLLNDVLSPVSDLPQREVMDVVLDELPNAEFRSAVIHLDHRNVQASCLTYRGLEFLLSREYREHPVALVREPGGPPWPAVVSQET